MELEQLEKEKDLWKLYKQKKFGTSEPGKLIIESHIKDKENSE